MENGDVKNGRMTIDRVEALRKFVETETVKILDELSKQKKIVDEPEKDPFLRASETAVQQNKNLTRWLEEAILEKIQNRGIQTDENWKETFITENKFICRQSFD